MELPGNEALPSNDSREPQSSEAQDSLVRVGAGESGSVKQYVLAAALSAVAACNDCENISKPSEDGYGYL